MKFEIYTTEGLIGYASSIKPFNIPGKQALMLEDFIQVRVPVEDKTVKPSPTPRLDQPEYKEREVVRPRLPNFDKKRETLTLVEGGKRVEVQLNEIGQTKQASYFRCPDCGQSAIVSVDGIIAFRVLDGDLEVVKTGTGIDINNYVYKNTEGDDSYPVVQLAADENTEGFCPKCLSTSKLLKWFAAWEDPLSFFEFEHPCAMCGAETVTTMQEGTEYRLCENKECGYKQKIGRVI